MRAFQCSKCKKLQDHDEYCMCGAEIDIRPRFREKGDAEKCKANFELLEEKARWHEAFYWEWL